MMTDIIAISFFSPVTIGAHGSIVPRADIRIERYYDLADSIVYDMHRSTIEFMKATVVTIALLLLACLY